VSYKEQRMYGEGAAPTTQWPPEQKWERAPWWARVFGFTWRRIRFEASVYDNAIYDYRTKRQLAREFLEKSYGQ